MSVCQTLFEDLLDPKSNNQMKFSFKCVILLHGLLFVYTLKF